MIEEEHSQQGADPPQTQRLVLPYVLVWVRDLVVSLIIAGIVILFIYQPVQVEGTSMMPALVSDERIFINKFTYSLGLEKIQRADAVVFWYPGDTSKSYIKRVIGLPGDRVRITDGIVYINGEPLTEAYVPAEYRDRSSYPEITVRHDEYYVLGDHRSMSNDSRNGWTVPRRLIYGKAVFVYWPPAKIGPVE